MKKIRVTINNNQKTIRIQTGVRMLIRRCCNAVIRLENFGDIVDVSVTFVNNEQMRELNKLHRSIDDTTDVLAFPMGENGVYNIDPATNAKILGDIVISVEKAEAQAKIYGHSFNREMAYLTTHAMLHLLGYDHKKPADRVKMREREESIMTQIGLPITTVYSMDDIPNEKN